MLFDYNRLRKEQRDKILTKWKPFLKGIEDDYLRESTAMLLENEAQYLVEEPSTTASDVVGIQKILLPIVRRVFPNLVANNLVSVQPLAGPTGVIFYLKYEFASTKSGTTAGDEYSMYSENPSDVSQGYNPYYSSDEVQIPAASITVNDGGGAAPSDFDFDLETGWVNGVDGSDWTDSTNALLKRVKVRFKAAVTATPTTYSTFLIQYDGREGKNYWHITETDRGGAGVALYGSAANAVFGALAAATAGYDSTTGKLANASVTFTDATDKFNVFASDQNDTLGTALTITGVEAWYAYKQEGSDAIPDMAISISQYPITVKSRKLKATWTNEAEQDLKAYHGLNADAELTALVSNEMIAEIDREIVRFCMDVVPISSWRYLDWNADVANNTSGNFLDRNRNLVQTVTELSNEIYRKSKIGPANWIITSPKVASYMEVLEGFVAAPAAQQGGLGIVKAGDMRGAVAVYKDPLFPTNKILMGHKSPASPFGAGVVYAPYVTQVTPTLYGPDDFTPRKGFLARYGLIQVPLGDLLYGMISIADLPGAV
jgi:hypothetical protein